MKPFGPLMIEHRLIERMVKLLGEELERIKANKEVNSYFIDIGVDFFRTYADRTHHGKEEDVLFRRLDEKQLFEEHQRIMDELVREHVRARELVTDLANAKEKYVNGQPQLLGDIVRGIEEIVALYSGHIDKEDNHFFRPVMDYFSKDEQDKMLDEFREFDRNMIHEKYKKVVEGCEKGTFS